MEFNPKNLQIVIGALWGVFSAFIYFFSTIYFWRISKNWLYIVTVGYGFQIVGLVTLFFLPESPRVLAQLNRLTKCKSSLE